MPDTGHSAQIPGSHKFLMGSEPGTMGTMKNISKCPGYLTPGHVNILVERVKKGIFTKSLSFTSLVIGIFS